jgi:hypothetical protein
VDYRSVCTIQAASALIGGTVLLLMPASLLLLFGLETDVSTLLVARMLGGMMFALGATLIGARELDAGPTRVRVIVGNATCDLCITVFLLADCYRGALGWPAGALALLFASNIASWLVTLRSP